MKKLFSLFVLPLVMLSASVAGAYPASRIQRPIKSDAGQAFMEKQSIANAVLADDNRLLVDQATSDSVTTTVTTFLAQPDVARAISILPGGTTADVPADDIVITGTDIHGGSMTETLTLLANQSTIENGTKAFATVTQIVFPVQDGTAATYDFGVIDVLGLEHCMNVAGHVFHTIFDGALEATAATCIADTDEIEKNTCDIDGTLDGAKDIEFYFLRNFLCTP